MLILIAVTVTTAIKGGLFEKTKQASKDTQKQSILEELIALTAEFNADLYANPDKYSNDELEQVLQEETIKRICGKNNENQNSSIGELMFTEEDEDFLAYIPFMYKGINAKWKFAFGEEGIDYIELVLGGVSIQETGDTPIVNAGENIKELTEDGVPIPKGFYYVTGTKDTGVVISDNLADENQADGNTGNQFVWVPVKLNSKLKIVIDGTKKISRVTIMDLEDYKEEINCNDKTYFEKTVNTNKNTIYEVAVEYEDGTREEKLYSTDLQYKQLSNNLRELKVLAEYCGGLENLADSLKENNYPDQNFEFKIDNFKEFFKDQEIYDTTDDTLEKDSVLKYGGFYIGRYEVGTDKTTKKGNSPKSYISFTEAKSEAEAIYNSESYGVKSSLPSGSAWNSTAKWIVNSKAESWNGVFNDSTSWGNYRLSISQRSSKINRK